MQASRYTFDDPIDRAVAGLYPRPEVARGARKGALSVELVRVPEIDDALRGEWRALTKASRDPNPYFAQWFLEPAMRTLVDPSGEVKLCLLRRADDGCLVGLAPIVFQKGYSKLPLKHMCVWAHRHCFNGAPMMRGGYEVAVFSGLFDWIDTRPEGASFIRFAHLPFDYPMHEALAEACDSRGRAFRVQEFHERAILTRENDFDAVMKAAMSGKKRKELRRQANRFADQGEAAFTDLPVADAIDEFLALENAGWKQVDPEGFPLARSVEETRFFREAMTEGAAQGAVTCSALTLDGAPKAMLFSLRVGDKVSAFKTSYDEAMSAYSPGVRLLIEATRAMLESDASVLDSCAKQGHPVVDGLWPERLPIAQINVPAARTADKTLLRTAATLEKLKNGAIKRLSKSR